MCSLAPPSAGSECHGFSRRSGSPTSRLALNQPGAHVAPHVSARNHLRAQGPRAGLPAPTCPPARPEPLLLGGPVNRSVW